MNDLSRKLAYCRNIKAYLSQLKALTNQDVTEEDLLSLDVVEDIREKSKGLIEKPKRKLVIPFEEKKEVRFQRFVQNLNQLNPSPVYIWTESTNSCGLFEIPSIAKFNFDFEYSVNREGIIVLLTKDFTDKMVLDFGEDAKGARLLEIELIGDHWPSATY
jgi:hypothetical protein